MKRLSAITLITLALWSCQSQRHEASDLASSSPSSFSVSANSLGGPRDALPQPVSPVCAALKEYPRGPKEKLSFEKGQISAICQPFVSQKDRGSLDYCGDAHSDPYSSNATSPITSRNSPREKTPGQKSRFTFASRNEMYRRGKVNLVSDPRYVSQAALFDVQAAAIREDAADLCCQDDVRCKSAMKSVEISLCKPLEGGESPDPCVFGGSYTMSGEGYSTIFGTIQRTYSTEAGSGLREIAEKNLGYYGPNRVTAQFSANPSSVRAKAGPTYPLTGKIVLTSYVSEKEGLAALIPTLNHELGHACSMIRMQMSAVSKDVSLDKATRAVEWLNLVKDRCDSNVKLSEAYYDFWEGLGESRGLAQCLYKIAEMNQKQQVDRKCEKLCPGHYLEEGVGIAFSLLNGDLKGRADSVFPTTCDHVRDGQHPMVSDVVDCLAQHSERFRRRLSEAYNCGPSTSPRSLPNPPLELPISAIPSHIAGQ